MKRIAFERLRAIPIVHIAEFLGVEITRRGANPRGVCPMCAKAAFALTPSKNLWWCFGKCKRGGDGLELVVEARQLSHTDAAKLLEKEFRPP